MSRFSSRLVVTAALLLACAAGGPAWAAPQAAVLINGQVLHSLTGEPVIGAKVIFQEDAARRSPARMAASASTSVRPGTYHLSVEAQGFSARHQEFVVAAPGTIINLLARP